MSFSRTNIWTAGQKLTADQINQIDINLTNSLDKRSGEINTIDSLNDFTQQISTSGGIQTNGLTNTSQSYFEDICNFSDGNLYTNPPTRKLLIPFITLEPLELPDTSKYFRNIVGGGEKYLCVNHLVYYNGYKNQKYIFNLNGLAIPEGAILNSITLFWTTYNYTTNPSNTSQTFNLHFLVSKSIEDVNFYSPAVSVNSMSDIDASAPATDLSWTGNQYQKSLTLNLSSLVYTKEDKFYNIMIETLNSSESTSSAALILYGIQINYNENLFAMP